MRPYPQHKYRPFQPIEIPDRRWPSNTITRPPIWCSVDLRDGNTFGGLVLVTLPQAAELPDPAQDESGAIFGAARLTAEAQLLG